MDDAARTKAYGKPRMAGRFHDRDWDRFKAAAARNGERISEMIARLLEREAKRLEAKSNR